MDAAGQVELDLAAGKLSMAGNSGPRCGRGRCAAERQGAPVAEKVLPQESSPAAFSNRRRMDRLWSTAISNRNGGAAFARRAAVDLTDDVSMKMRKHHAIAANGARTALAAAVGTPSVATGIRRRAHLFAVQHNRTASLPFYLWRVINDIAHCRAQANHRPRQFAAPHNYYCTFSATDSTYRRARSSRPCIWHLVYNTIIPFG